MSEEIKEYKRYVLVVSGGFLLEGALICLLSAAGVLVDNQTPLIGIIFGILIFSGGVLLLLIFLAQSKGWIKQSIDERSAKIVYKAAFHAYWIMMFVGINLVLLGLFKKIIVSFPTGVGVIIASGYLSFLFSMGIQQVIQER